MNMVVFTSNEEGVHICILYLMGQFVINRSQEILMHLNVSDYFRRCN